MNKIFNTEPSNGGNIPSGALALRIMEALPIPLFLFDTTGSLLYANKAGWQEFSDVLGVPLAYGGNLNELLAQIVGLAVYQEEGGRVLQPNDAPVMQALQTGSVVQKIIKRTIQRTGAVKWYVNLGVPIRDEEGAIAWSVSANVDITTKQDDLTSTIASVSALKSHAADMDAALRQHREWLAQTSNRLSSTTDDLQQFIHVASHDLKEPVRKIRTYASKMLKELEHSPPETFKIQLQRIDDAASQLMHMIDGVQMFSGMEAHIPEWSAVALHQVAQQAINLFETTLHDTGAKVTVAPLPTVWGVAHLLQQLTANLLSNALKFSRIGVPPQIHISAFQEAMAGKWLCMMYPRLKLLHKLMSPEGSIWLSIDDNEAHLLKILLDEIFGVDCFVADLIWKKRDGAPNDRKVGYVHEHILVFAKTKSSGSKKTLAEERFNLIERSEKANKEYKVFKEPNGPDPKGAFRKIDTTANGKGGRFVESLFYPITNPYTKEDVWPRKGTCWRHNREDMIALQGENRLYWGVDGRSTTPMRKLYISEARDGMTVPSIWDDVALNQHGAREIELIFGEKAAFDTPKPVDLVKRIIHIATNNNAVVLDSFAGSGTTAHAVLNLNKADGGNRKFILVEMEDYAETITAERVKRVIGGYGDKEGTGGGFDYYTLGAPLFDAEGNLNEAVPLDKIREYIFYSETRQPLPPPASHSGEESSHFLGLHEGTALYFFYQPDTPTTLDLHFLATVKTRADQYIIYADTCLLEPSFMQQHHIIFKKIPRDITRF